MNHTALKHRTAQFSLLLACMMLATRSTAHAYLGGFESEDGYRPFLNMVQNYNAGQYGTNNGGPGGGPVGITPNTGLWQAASGGFGIGQQISYATGHQNFDRTYVNSGHTSGLPTDQALLLTTGHQGWDGPALEYHYSLDSRDLNGAPVSATANSVVTVSMWWCAQLDSNVGDGYFGDAITFVDSSGNEGFVFGLTERAAGDTVTFWDGNTMQESMIVGPAGWYDRWDIKFDLANDTFDADYYQFSTGSTYNLVTGGALQANMLDLAQMYFRSSPGVNNAKYFSVDDVSFTVIPEPGAAWLIALAPLSWVMRRRRQG